MVPHEVFRYCETKKSKENRDTHEIFRFLKFSET